MAANENDEEEILESFSAVVSEYSFSEDMKQNADAILMKNSQPLCEFRKAQYEEEAVRNWDIFYKKIFRSATVTENRLLQKFVKFCLFSVIAEESDKFLQGQPACSSHATFICVHPPPFESKEIELNSCNVSLSWKWLFREFSEFNFEGEEATERTLVEVGCGVGNTIIPLLLKNPYLRAFCLDCSKRAIHLLQQRWLEILSSHPTAYQTTHREFSPPESDACQRNPFEQESLKNTMESPSLSIGRLEKAMVLDVTTTDPCSTLCPEGIADIVILIFCLSSIHPRHYERVASYCAKLLKPNGRLLFRDYGKYDMAQLRFARSGKSKIEENFYVQELRMLFCEKAGLREEENRYHTREFLNRKTQVKMPRVWVQARFQKS
ncbi:putative methylase [Cardiosporidium cionae]|uniref:tRNA N(3)-methylcytidine methyltransferase n=1 Tax=Cardiosporidium cionae TaxID=476202 RepID=A0ABQ7JFU1_9APIC|nr:putative methylase [Cardiosporidium cionae]|eukprot:KAF8822851.1 putative methylase [Cardiosporidium cionae]